MGNKLYVGNLPYSTTESDLHDLFSASGTVDSVRIITDRDTGRSRGFGFITFASAEDAAKAVEKANGTELDGRDLRVNLAEDKPERARSGGDRQRW